MRYRVSTLLLLVTTTAIALAGRPWLIDQRHDLEAGVLIFLLCAATGFAFGWSATHWTPRLNLIAAAFSGIVANWILFYYFQFAVGYIRSPNTGLGSLSAILVWLLKVYDMYGFSTLAIASTLAMLAAAWIKREQLLAASIAVSFFLWFAAYWLGFVSLAVASEILD